MNKVKLLYSTYITAAGSGQVDSVISVDFESVIQVVQHPSILGLRNMMNLFVSINHNIAIAILIELLL